MTNAFALPMCHRSCAVDLPQGDQTDKKKPEPSFQQFLNSAAVHSSKKVMDEVVKFRSQLVSASVLAVSIL